MGLVYWPDGMKESTVFTIRGLPRLHFDTVQYFTDRIYFFFFSRQQPFVTNIFMCMSAILIRWEDKLLYHQI